jgi:hypothetical protein
MPAVYLAVALAAVAASPAAAGGAALGGGAAADFGDTPRSGPDANETDSPVVVQNATVSNHPRSGYVTLNLSYRVGADANALVTFDSHWTTVTASHGFSEQPNGRWLWDGTSERPWLSMQVRVNRTSRRFDGYAWYDAGPWALVKPPRGFSFYSDTRDEWISGGTETPMIRRHMRVRGPGVAGGTMAYLGNYTTYATNGTDHRISLVVPSTASVEASPGTVLDMLNRTASQLDVGARPERLTVFVAPDPIRRGGLASGIRYHDTDIWIAENESIDAPANIWIHEYVHARQDARLGSRMWWFREASASYYAGLLSVRQGLGGADRFDRFVARLHRGTSEDAVLADRSTWPHSLTPYAKGQRVLAGLDARIRNETDDNRTLMTVFRRVNSQNGSVGYDDFDRIVTNVSGTNMSGWLATHVDSSRPADPPRSPYAYVSPGGETDPDDDGLSSSREQEFGTNPFTDDSDGDGLEDPAELRYWTDPTAADTDGDGYADGTERAAGSDPRNPFSVPHGAVPFHPR